MDHVLEGNPVHGAGHDHSHGHDHDHAHGANEYFLQKLLTVGVSGAFGVAGILMYTLQDTVRGEKISKLGHLLVPGFHPWVLAGSVVLLVLTAIRGYALWVEAGQRRAEAEAHAHPPGEACAHDHVHGPDCDHADHDHSDHDHGNIYWRVIVLAFPIALLIMGLPNGGFSEARLKAMIGEQKELGNLGAIESSGKRLSFDFDTLASTAYSAEKRAEYTGYEAVVDGLLQPIPGAGGKQFTLFTEKMTCCRSDQIILKARGVVQNPSQLDAYQAKGLQMVQVRGTLQYAESSPGEYIPVIRVDPNGGLTLKGKR